MAEKKIVLMYDFDYTLSKNYMQSYKLIRDFGFDDIWAFFDVINSWYDKDTDKCLSAMGGILALAKENGIDITREYLAECGKDIEFYDGVIDWFDNVNKVGKKLGYKVEHYIISSGQKEIIDGCKIASKVKKIFGCSYVYDKSGVAVWPSQLANYTLKTQFIYRIRKNCIDNLGDLVEINKKMDPEKILPFKQMIYLGDSETDIPSFKTIKNGGGLAICVYDESSPESREIAQECFIDGRVNFVAPANYTENRELFQMIKNYMENIAGKEID